MSPPSAHQARQCSNALDSVLYILSHNPAGQVISIEAETKTIKEPGGYDAMAADGAGNRPDNHGCGGGCKRQSSRRPAFLVCAEAADAPLRRIAIAKSPAGMIITDFPFTAITGRISHHRLVALASRNDPRRRDRLSAQTRNDGSFKSSYSSMRICAESGSIVSISPAAFACRQRKFRPGPI